MTLYKNRLQGSLGIYTPFMPITMNAQTTKHYDGWNTLCLQNSLKYFFVGNQSYGICEKKDQNLMCVALYGTLDRLGFTVLKTQRPIIIKD